MPRFRDYDTPQAKKELLDFYKLDDDDGRRLQEGVEVILNTPNINRRAHVNTVGKAILEKYRELTIVERRLWKTGIQLYFHRYACKKQSKDIFGYMRAYLRKAVIAIIHQNRLETIVTSLSGATPGKQEYLAHYQKGLQKLTDELSDEELQDADRLAEEWTLRAPPKDIQARNAEKYCSAWSSKFGRRMAQQLGAYCVVVVAYLDRTGEPAVEVFDTAKELGVEPVTRAYPECYTSGLVTSMQTHAIKVWGPEVGGLPEKIPMTRRRAVCVEVPVRNGNLILLDRKLHETLPAQKGLVRGIARSAYQIAGGSEQAPWTELSQDFERKIMPPEYLPDPLVIDGVKRPFIVNDPTKMRSGLIARLLDHWYDRAKKGLVPLAFHPVSGATGKTNLYSHLDDGESDFDLEQTGEVKRSKQKSKKKRQAAKRKKQTKLKHSLLFEPESPDITDSPHKNCTSRTEPDKSRSGELESGSSGPSGSKSSGSTKKRKFQLENSDTETEPENSGAGKSRSGPSGSERSGLKNTGSIKKRALQHENSDTESPPPQKKPKIIGGKARPRPLEKLPARVARHASVYT